MARPSFDIMKRSFPYPQQYHNTSFIWKMIGGDVAALNIKDPITYSNACALRMSWALNKSGVIIPKNKNTYYGKDKQYSYFISSDKLKDYILNIWGKPELIWQGALHLDESIYQKIDTQQHRIVENERGLIHFSADGNRKVFGAAGHLDLWDKTGAVDEPFFTPQITRISLWKLP